MESDRNTPSKGNQQLSASSGHRDPDASESCAVQLSEAARQAEQRYRDFLEIVPVPIHVFNLDGTVSYLNPAFEKVFGWTLSELRGKRIPFVPDHLRAETRREIKRLLSEKSIRGLQTQRLTKDGRLLDILLDAALLFDEKGGPSGHVVTSRNITRQLRMDRINRALFRIAKALHRLRGLDERLDFITREVQDLIGCENAHIILIDEKKKEFFFRSASSWSAEAERKYRETSLPLDKGVAGRVYQTGKPVIVSDYYSSPYAFTEVDQKTGVRTENILDVPIWADDHMIGVLCAANKNTGDFDTADIELMDTIAGIVALPIVNAGMNEALQKSYENVQSLNRAKDRVIHHLSHELKTPISVLDASFTLLRRRLSGDGHKNIRNILDRAGRNLQRLLEMQYEIEDILREKDYASHHMMLHFLEACTDLLEALASEILPDADIGDRLRNRIDELFGLREGACDVLELDRVVNDVYQRIADAFSLRDIDFRLRLEAPTSVWAPRSVLEKIIAGLIRNAIENTPDGGRVDVSTSVQKGRCFLTVGDTGIGITDENKRLLFENYFTAYETMQYATKKPFAFGAGGRGFDLLRMKIFSERYHFNIRLTSERCPFIVEGTRPCPGKISDCPDCSKSEDCFQAGGTTVTVSFPPVELAMTDTPETNECVWIPEI